MQDTGVEVTKPTTREGWGGLAQQLGIKTIHIAERDTQVCQTQPKRPGEFVNTWSVDGFISEGCQPAELGWGTRTYPVYSLTSVPTSALASAVIYLSPCPGFTQPVRRETPSQVAVSTMACIAVDANATVTVSHVADEKNFPIDGEHHKFGTDAAIFLNRPGCTTKVRTWTPSEGPFHGFLVTHNESISIADYFTVREGDKVVYRPTVHYAYHPCDDAVLSLHELAGKNYIEQKEKRLMVDEITDGIDELGVLLCGHSKGAYWCITLDRPRRRFLSPCRSMTVPQPSCCVRPICALPTEEHTLTLATAGTDRSSRSRTRAH